MCWALICVTALQQLSHAAQQSGLTKNRCYLKPQAKLIRTAQRQVFEKTNILKIFKNLVELHYNNQLPAITVDNNILYTSLNNCLFYGKPFGLGEKFRNFKGKKILNFFIIQVDQQYFCIIEGVHKNQNDCLKEIKTLAKIFNSPIPTFDHNTISRDFLNIFKFTKSNTQILTYGTKLAFLGENEDVVCKDQKFRNLKSLTDSFLSQLRSPISTIFNFIKPLLHKTQTQKFFITNDKYFYNTWQNLDHYQELLSIFLDEEKFFPTFIFNEAKKPDVLPKGIFLYLSLFDILKHRQKKSLLDYIFNGDQVNEIAKNQNIFLENFQIMSNNDKRLLAQQKKFSAATQLVTINEKKINKSLRETIKKLNQLSSDLHQIYRMIISDILSNAKSNRIRHLMNLINIFDEELTLYLQNIVSMAMGRSSCSLNEDNVLCQVSEPTFEIHQDLSLTFKANIFHFKNILLCNCLPFYNMTFAAENSELIFDQGHYKDIKTSKLYKLSCFEYIDICPENYKKAEYSLFNRCNFIYGNNIIYINCYQSTQIITSEKKIIHISDEPQMFKYQDFPLTFQNEIFSLNDIFIEITDSLGINSLLEDDDNLYLNTLDLVTQKPPGLSNVTFDILYDLQNPARGSKVHINTFLTSFFSFIGLVLLVLAIFCMVKKLNMIKMFDSKLLLYCCQWCRKSQPRPGQQQNETNETATEMRTFSSTETQSDHQTQQTVSTIHATPDS